MVVAARGVGGGGSGGGLPPETRQERTERRAEQLLIVGLGVGLTLVVLGALQLGGALQDADVLGGGLDGGDGSGLGAGDLVGGALWALSLYFCSPIQLVLLFFGSYDRERPSDWVLRLLGRAAALE